MFSGIFKKDDIVVINKGHLNIKNTNFSNIPKDFKFKVLGENEKTDLVILVDIITGNKIIISEDFLVKVIKDLHDKN